MNEREGEEGGRVRRERGTDGGRERVWTAREHSIIASDSLPVNTSMQVDATSVNEDRIVCGLFAYIISHDLQ